jgi:hypothetical protein
MAAAGASENEKEDATAQWRVGGKGDWALRLRTVSDELFAERDVAENKAPCGKISTAQVKYLIGILPGMLLKLQTVMAACPPVVRFALQSLVDMLGYTVNWSSKRPRARDLQSYIDEFEAFSREVHYVARPIPGNNWCMQSAAARCGEDAARCGADAVMS